MHARYMLNILLHANYIPFAQLLGVAVIVGIVDDVKNSDVTII